MSFYNTNNPVPSDDPRDLDDNTKHIDEIVNSTFPTFVDRLGTARMTLAGIEADNASLATTLANSSDPAKGIAIVGFKAPGTNTLGRTSRAKVIETVSVTDYALWAPGTYAAAIQQAIDDLSSLGRGIIEIPVKGTFPLEQTVNLKRDVILRGSGLESTFLTWNGNGPAIKFAPLTPLTFNPGCHAIETISIIGGNNPLAIGVQISDTFAFRIENVGIGAFTQGRGLELRNINKWTEGTILLNTRIGNNKIGIAFVREAAATDSFGYTRFLNASIDVRDGQTGMLVGDDTVTTTLVSLYNSILNCNIWLSGNNATGISFGQNSVISDGNGLLNGENSTGTGCVMVEPNTLTSGFRNSDVFVRSSPLNDSETIAGRFRDFRYKKIRDVGEQRPGQGTVPQWFKVAKIDATFGLFTGRVSTQSQTGASANRSATCDFAFGVAGGSPLPQFTVSGEGFNGSTTPYSRFKLATDGVDTFLYYLRPSFTHVCVFEYSYNWARNDTVELWETSADPSSIGGLTVTWDSFNNAAQQGFNGDEQNFTGQRQIVTTNGSTTVYNIPHALGVAPEYYFAVAMSADATSTEISSVTADATNIIVTFKAATPAGTGNVKFAVEYARKQFRKQARP